MKTNSKNGLLLSYIKRVVLIAVFSTFAVGAMAQSNDYYKNGYVTNSFWSNWFIQGGAGSSIYLGGQNAGKFQDRNSLVFDAALGKWITPSVGLRLQYNNSQVKQYSSIQRGFAFYGKNSDGNYLQKFGVQSLHGDFLWNMSAGVGGYKQSRFYEIIPFVGFGVVKSEGRDLPAKVTVKDNYDYAASAGIINKFRVSNSFDVNLELRGTAVHSSFDGVELGNRVDGLMAATLGVTYRFGKVRGFQKTSDVIAMNTPEPVVIKPNTDEIDRLKAALKKEQDLNKKLQDQLNNAPKAVAPAPEVRSIPSTYSLFFDLGKTTLDAKNLANLDAAATMIKNNPSKTFRIEAYADKKTGSAKRNQVITEKRAQYVYDYLVKSGIKSEQLAKVANGANNLPFKENDLNRVVIIMN